MWQQNRDVLSEPEIENPISKYDRKTGDKIRNMLTLLFSYRLELENSAVSRFFFQPEKRESKAGYDLWNHKNHFKKLL